MSLSCIPFARLTAISVENRNIFPPLYGRLTDAVMYNRLWRFMSRVHMRLYFLFTYNLF